MAEELVDDIVIKTTWEKGSTTETPMPLTSTPQFEKEVLAISNIKDLCWLELQQVNYSFSQTDIYIRIF